MSDSAPPTEDGPDRDSSSASAVAVWLVGGFGVYFGVFAILFLDDIVFRTHLCARWCPQLGPPARILFYPLLVIASWLGWLPGPLPPLF